MSISSNIVALAAGEIGELLVKEAKLLYEVEDQVQSLQDELTMMQSFLIDMEAMEEDGGSECSCTTIKQIRKIAYDAEDVTEDVFKRYLCFSSSLSHTHQIGFKIESIRGRIVETIERWKKYQAENVDARQGLSKRNRVRMGPIGYSHTFEDHVVGLDEDINKLVGVLTNEEYTKIKVVSMVGMGGSGKTTLTRKLFNHGTIKTYFDYVAWVSVSQQILLDLLKKASCETMRVEESSFSHQVLIEKLCCHLERRYLIVLDYVWEEKAVEHILPAFPLGSDGRKIIITTRNKKVVDYPDLKPLTYQHEPRHLTIGCDCTSWHSKSKGNY